MNIAGLALNILGVIVLFIFGFPQPDFEESVGLALEDNTPIGGGKTAAEHARDRRAKKRSYKRRAYFGLTLVLLGLILQLIGAVN